MLLYKNYIKYCTGSESYKNNKKDKKREREKEKYEFARNFVKVNAERSR